MLNKTIIKVAAATIITCIGGAVALTVKSRLNAKNAEEDHI